jgi:integrase
MNRLMAYREKKPTTHLIFGAGGGEHDVPDGHLLRRLKTLVRNAVLNCGVCDGCKKTKECGRWFLHKFRASYITTLLRNGLDLRTVMKLSGHSDLESVMRYLRPAEDAAIQEKVNTIKWR